MLPGGQLPVGGRSVDRDGTRSVGEVAAVGGAKVENIEFTGPAGPPAWRSAADTAGVVIAGAGEHLAAGGHGDRLQRRKDFELGDSRPDDLAGPRIHLATGGDGPLQEQHFIRIFSAPQPP